MECSARTAESINIQFARCFLRLANLDNGAFERLVGTKARYGGKLAGSPLRCGSGIAVVSYGIRSRRLTISTRRRGVKDSEGRSHDSC
jgi:hypothetical protein